MRTTLAHVERHHTYLVSYPRSGSTWLRCMLTALLNDGRIDVSLVAETVPDVHRTDPSHRPARTPVIVKSHAPVTAEMPQVVYVVRDGLEAMTSYAAHQVEKGRVRAEDVDAWALSDAPWPCRWDEHVVGWLDRFAAAPDVGAFVVRYEDLRADPGRWLTKVAGRCGISADPTDIERAVSAARLDNLVPLDRGPAGDSPTGGAGLLDHVGQPRARFAPATTAALRARFAAARERLGYRSAPG